MRRLNGGGDDGGGRGWWKVGGVGRGRGDDAFDGVGLVVLGEAAAVVAVVIVGGGGVLIDGVGDRRTGRACRRLLCFGLGFLPGRAWGGATEVVPLAFLGGPGLHHLGGGFAVTRGVRGIQVNGWR